MKKYFVKETNEELQFGDVVELSFYKELEDGSVSREMEVKLTPEIVDTLVKLNIIEVKEEEDDKPILDFNGDEDDDKCPYSYGVCLDELCEDLENLEEKVESIEKEVQNLHKLYVTLRKEMPKSKK